MKRGRKKEGRRSRHGSYLLLVGSIAEGGNYFALEKLESTKMIAMPGRQATIRREGKI